MTTKAPTTIDADTLALLRQVCEDALDLISCNCSYELGTPKEQRCDGHCTPGMAKRALARLDALQEQP